MQRYLRFSGVVGKPRVRDYRVRLRGAIRSDLDSPWMSFTADQHSFVEPATRLLLLEASRGGIPVSACHRHVGRAATFRLRLASLATIVDARGPEMDVGETVTLFNDLGILAPAALVDAGVRWEEVDSRTLRGTSTNAGHTVAAVLTCDSAGVLRYFVSDDRFQTADGKRFARLRWSTPVNEWREFGGLRLAARPVVRRSGAALRPFAQAGSDFSIRSSCRSAGCGRRAGAPRSRGPACSPGRFR